MIEPFKRNVLRCNFALALFIFSILRNEILQHDIDLRHFQEAKSENKNYSFVYLPSSLQLR